MNKSSTNAMPQSNQFNGFQQVPPNNYSQQQQFTQQQQIPQKQQITPAPKDSPASWAGRAFKSLDSENRGYLYKHEILGHIKHGGVYSHHQLQTLINALESKAPKDPIDFQEFEYLLHGQNFIKRVLENNLVIPQYPRFHQNFEKIFHEIKEDTHNEYSWGEVADYIPSLGKADPKWFASAFCSADGQFSQLGDYDGKFSMQSVSKVVAYAYVYDLYVKKGRGDDVHKYVGEEPSGVVFNAPVFDGKGRPHNPMVNAGAIMVSTLLVNEGKTIEDFQHFYMKACNAKRADIDLPLYKEEALTGSTNHALRSLMLSKGAYPKKENFEATKKLADDGLDWYFVQCSMLVDCEGMARFGAMLANNGINPSTGERIVEPETVKATVTLMQTCGMYNGAGKFTKDHGVPTKSGVSGGLMTVIPGIGAFATWSPPLNEEGNCVRGIGMIEKMSGIYNNINLFHKDQKKRDMTRKAYQTLLMTVIVACTSAASGDLETISRLHVQGFDINSGDYDKRTPLHLASAAGHLEIVKYLVEHGAEINPKDRWGATPLNDAQDSSIIEYLANHGAEKGVDQSDYLELPQVTVTDEQFRLYFAAYDGDLLLIQTLHILGWKVNAYDYDGRTALGIAASEGHLDVVKYLVSHGANPLHRDIRNNDAISDARREGREDVIEYLEKVLNKRQ